MPELLGVLCVDDEPNVLAGLALHLRREYRVVTAESGAAGLVALAEQGPFGVIVSDMRMPGMDGATFLAQARETAPDATRLLLTGQADIDSAIHAINDGHVFRFLTKPCAPVDLRAAVADAAEQHRLVVSERVLLGQTLLGSVKALLGVLSLANPLVFGRATRVTGLVKDLLSHTEAHNRWAVEVAAMLADLGCIALPDAVVRRYYSGAELSKEEVALVARSTKLTETLLANIPRLEPVIDILRLAAEPGLPRAIDAASGDAGIVRLALDFDSLESNGLSHEVAIHHLRQRMGRHNPLIKALETCRGNGAPRSHARRVAVEDLAVGQVLAADVHAASGQLILARGNRITADFVERCRHAEPGHLPATVLILEPHGG